ncbi:hypothetical protein LUZ60_008843 [Juncus effusus]|nr:hypothetical protein LUZ60_008843 [Juncus effusus]
MGLFGMMGDSFGCSATGERLVSAARDGDFQEAKALLEYNPRLAKYSTFGVRNSPLHYSASHGHHEIVSLLIESGMDMNLRNYRGQTALMQACLYGHWKVVQTLILFKANIYKKDYLSGGTALHFAALNGRSRCVRLLVADFVPSISEFYDLMRTKSQKDILSNKSDSLDEVALSKIINKKADGGITALHLAALNGHVECVQLLLDLGADLKEVTINDGSTIDLIGAGSTSLHYASCGGNAVCCQILIASGASLTAENANGLTPLMVARAWHKNGLEHILSKKPETLIRVLPSPFLSLPLMSIVKIARECGWRRPIQSPACVDPCVICLEMKCMVAAQGCNHEFCIKCALYLCSTATSSYRSATSSSRSATSASATSSSRPPPGSLPCPLCRSPIVSFNPLPTNSPLRVKLLTWSKSKSTNSYESTLTVGSARSKSKSKLRYEAVDLGCGGATMRKLKMRPSTLCDESSRVVSSCLRPELRRSVSERRTRLSSSNYS